MPSNPQPNPRLPGLPSSLSDPSVAELPPRTIAGRMLHASPCSLLTSSCHCEPLSLRHRHTLSSRHCEEPPSRHCKATHYVIARSPLHVIARQPLHVIARQPITSLQDNPSRHCEERSDVAISGRRSTLSGFILSIILSFLSLFQDLICFSRAIASRTLLYSS